MSAPGVIGALGVGSGWRPDAWDLLGQLLYADWDARRTDLMTIGSGVVSSWLDSFAGIDLAQPTAASRPAHQGSIFNGGPAVVPDGAGDYLTATLSNPIASGRRPYVWIAGSFPSSPSVQLALMMTNSLAGASGSAFLDIYRGAQFRSERGDGGGTIVTTNAQTSDTDRHIFEAGFTADGVSSLVVDGVAFNSTQATPTTTAISYIRLFGAFGASFSAGPIARCIIASDDPSLQQKVAVRAYMMGANHAEYAGNSYK